MPRRTAGEWRHVCYTCGGVLSVVGRASSGHSLGAAGAIEAACTVLAFRHRTVPAVVDFQAQEAVT
ncbi:hypothetical protein [Streptomyces abikoensis]|uniref:Beta-ketoacyl synthase C-terminal domain-containing protein n=1 Tax=Streptomyces abikoensis TaxID=97398 RepID=A0ABW7TI60_9ACTN